MSANGIKNRFYFRYKKSRSEKKMSKHRKSIKFLFILLFLLKVINIITYEKLIIGYIIVFFICMLLAIKILKENYKSINGYIPGVVLTILVLLNCILPIKKWEVKIQLERYREDREQVIENVKNEKESLNKLGVCALAEKYEKISDSGEIVIYQNDTEGMVVGFWLYRGLFNAGCSMLMYSSLDNENDIKQVVDYIEEIKKVSINWYYVTLN